MKRFLKLSAAVSCLFLAFVLIACTAATTTEKRDDNLKVTNDKGSKTPYYVLIIGNDSREDTIEINRPEYSDGKGRSDVIMLARIDPSTYQITLVTVPRDTTTLIGGAEMKLNQIYYEEGAAALVDEVSALTGVRIDYYLDMGFTEFAQFVNDMRGVEVNVPINMAMQDIISGSQVSLEAGTQKLQGDEALVFARTRKAYANDHDACRQMQNRQIVQMGISKVLADPASAAASCGALLANTETNWKKDDLLATITDFVNNADKVTFLSGTGPYNGSLDPTSELWLIPRDIAAWKQLIRVIDAGGDPRNAVALPQIAAGS